MYFHLIIFSIFFMPHLEIISKAEENPSADEKGQVQSYIEQTVGNSENSDGRIGELIQKFPFLEKASRTAIDEFDEILNDTNLTKSELDNRRLEWANKQNNADVEIAYQKWKEQIEVGKHEAFKRIESKFGLFAKMRKLYRKIKEIILDHGITREQECQRIHDILIGSDIDADLREEFLQQINIQLVEFCLHQKPIEHISAKPQEKSENLWPNLSMDMSNSTSPMIGQALNKMASAVPSSSSSSSSSENLEEEEKNEKGKRRKEREEEEDSDEKRKKRKKEKKAKRKREKEERKERKKKREEKPKEIKEEKRDESVMKDEDGSNNLSNSNSSSSSSEEDGNMEKADKNHDRKKIRNREEEEQKEGSTSSSSSQSSSQSSEEGKDEVDKMEKLLKEKAKKLKKKKNHHQNEEDEDMDSSENSDETSKNARHWAI